MSIYFFIRYGLLGIALVGWIVYQLIIKKKKFGDLQGDLLMVICLIGVWVALSYFMLD